MTQLILTLVNFLSRFIGMEVFNPDSREEVLLIPRANVAAEPYVPPAKYKPGLTIKEDLLPINPNSRSGNKMAGKPKAVVVHWVAGPNHEAKNVRNYFANLKDRYASTHYIVGLKGEVIKMIPHNEVGWHVGGKSYLAGIQAEFGRNPNYTTVGIECCHPDWSGKMHTATMQSLEVLCAHLLKEFSLPIDRLMLHRDFTGKNCHKWFVDHPDEWAAFKDRVSKLLKDGLV